MYRPGSGSVVGSGVVGGSAIEADGAKEKEGDENGSVGGGKEGSTTPTMGRRKKLSWSVMG